MSDAIKDLAADQVRAGVSLGEAMDTLKAAMIEAALDLAGPVNASRRLGIHRNTLLLYRRSLLGDTRDAARRRQRTGGRRS